MLVNNTALINNVVNNLNQIQEQMQTYTAQLSSGKRVLKPGDDPNATNAIMNFQTQLDQNQTYQNNAQDGQGWLQTTETALGSISNIMATVRTVALQASNGTLSSTDRQTDAQEVSSLLGQTQQLANQKYGNFFLFGGTSLGPNSSIQPFSQTAPNGPFTYNGNANTSQGTILRQVSDSDFLAVNLSGPGPNNGPSVLTDSLNALQNLANDLNANNIGNLQNDLQTIDTATQETTAATTWIGSQTALIQQTGQFLTSQSGLLQGLQAKVQDADTAQVMMEFSNAQAALQATLKAGSELIQPTLLDFLK